MTPRAIGLTDRPGSIESAFPICQLPHAVRYFIPRKHAKLRFSTGTVTLSFLGTKRHLPAGTATHPISSHSHGSCRRASVTQCVLRKKLSWPIERCQAHSNLRFLLRLFNSILHHFDLLVLGQHSSDLLCNCNNE